MTTILMTTNDILDTEQQDLLALRTDDVWFEIVVDAPFVDGNVDCYRLGVCGFGPCATGTKLCDFIDWLATTTHLPPQIIHDNISHELSTWVTDSDEELAEQRFFESIEEELLATDEDEDDIVEPFSDSHRRTSVDIEIDKADAEAQHYGLM